VVRASLNRSEATGRNPIDKVMSFERRPWERSGLGGNGSELNSWDGGGPDRNHGGANGVRGTATKAVPPVTPRASAVSPVQPAAPPNRPPG
jgi:hypothetical protein